MKLTYAITAAIIAASVPAPASAGFWSSAWSSVKSVFSGGSSTSYPNLDQQLISGQIDLAEYDRLRRAQGATDRYYNAPSSSGHSYSNGGDRY
jgi:hypothetical protein